MMKEGNIGGHFGVVAPGYIKGQVVPLINEWAGPTCRRWRRDRRGAARGRTGRGARR